MHELLKRVVAVAVVELVVINMLAQWLGLGPAEARLLEVVMEELVKSLLDRLFPGDRD